MKSFFPIISSEGGLFTAILVHAENISNQLGYDNLLKVAKTNVVVHPEDEWEFILLDRTQEVALLSSSDIEVSKPTNIDLIAILGHQISLASWQILCLKSDVDRGLYVTYLADE